MEFRVLGPVSVARDGEELALGGPKPRALLAMLLLRANEPVSRDALIDGLWGDRPPVTAAHTIEDYVSRLRRAIGSERLPRRQPGYLVAVEPDELDLDRFERLTAAARAALARGDAAEAAALFRSAIAEWRGPTLADVVDAPFAAAACRDLDERRLLAVEDRLEADLRAGRGSELVPELMTLVREEPFRERPVAQLMLAQYRAGDAAGALDTCTSARRRFAEELGLELGPSVKLLERRILEHDPSLAAPEATPPPAGHPRRRRVRVVSFAAFGVVAAVGAWLAFTGGGEHGQPRVGAEQVLVALDAEARPVGRPVALDARPAAVAAAEGSIWVADPDGEAILRVDASAGSVVDRIPVRGTPGALAVGGGSLWVATELPGAVKRIDIATGLVTQTIPLGVNPSAIAFGEGAVWVADPTDKSVIEVDPVRGVVEATVSLTTRPTAITVGGGAVWIASHDDGVVVEIDPRADVAVATVAVGQGPSALAFGAGSLWVTNRSSGTVSRIDPQTGNVVGTFATGSGPTALAVVGASVWVANEFSGTVSRIDPNRNRIVATATSGGAPVALARSSDVVWVGTRSAADHRGGTLVLLSQGPFSSMDPALEYQVWPPQLHGLAYDALVTFEHVGGPGGLRLVPDLALALPSPTDAGRTYVFRLRPGIRYSDGRLLEASDVRRAFERLYRVSSPITSHFGAIAGSSRCGPEVCDLRGGIVTVDRLGTVVFHLSRPDPQFLFKLAFVFTAPVPPGTPWNEMRVRPFPGTGPYRIARATRREVVLVRNRYFREWSHAAQPAGNPDRIVWRFGRSSADEVRAIETGRADWMFDKVPAGRLRELTTRFGSQFHSNAAPQTDFLLIDTRLPPLDDVRVRRALNLAIDRRLIARLYGGPAAAKPTCQVLPPGVPGYRPYCPYTVAPRASGRWTGPDLERARSLVVAAQARGARIELWGFADDASVPPAVVRYVASAVRRIGLRVHVGWTTHSRFDRLPMHVQRTIHLLPNAWFADFPAASDFFDVYIACKGAFNRGRFCDPRLDREMRKAAALELTEPQRASALWSRIDRRAVDQAVWIPLVNPRSTDLVSARVRNYQHNPMWGFLADQVWLR